MAINGGIPETQKPLDRLFHVLSTVADAGTPLSVTDIATICHLPVPTVHRQVAQLEDRRFLRRTLGSKKLIVGDALLKLGAAAIASSLRADPVHHILASLAERTGEHCEIGLRVDSQVSYIDSAASEMSQQGLRFEQGQRSPLYCSSIGKLFLAELDDDVFEQWLKHATLKGHTMNTLTDHQSLRAEIARVRQSQWASTNEELVPGVVGCAVPIRDRNQRLIAGLAVSVPAPRVSFNELTRFRDPMNDAARAIAATFEGA